MKRVIFYLIVLALAIGSANAQIKVFSKDVENKKWPKVEYLTVGKNQIDKDLMSYYELFVAEAAMRGFVFEKPIKLSFFIDTSLQIKRSGNKEYTHSVDGYMEKSAGITRLEEFRVLINYRLWPYLNYCEREFLIFHELGHYYMMRDHVFDRLSIMNTNIPFDYKLNRGYYMDELFFNTSPLVKEPDNVKCD